MCFLKGFIFLHQSQDQGSLSRKQRDLPLWAVDTDCLDIDTWTCRHACGCTCQIHRDWCLMFLAQTWTTDGPLPTSLLWGFRQGWWQGGEPLGLGMCGLECHRAEVCEGVKTSGSLAT